jgi:hypothetical protein
MSKFGKIPSNFLFGNPNALSVPTPVAQQVGMGANVQQGPTGGTIPPYIQRYTYRKPNIDFFFSDFEVEFNQSHLTPVRIEISTPMEITETIDFELDSNQQPMGYGWVLRGRQSSGLPPLIILTQPGNPTMKELREQAHQGDVPGDVTTTINVSRPGEFSHSHLQFWPVAFKEVWGTGVIGHQGYNDQHSFIVSHILQDDPAGSVSFSLTDPSVISSFVGTGVVRLDFSLYHSGYIPDLYSSVGAWLVRFQFACPITVTYYYQ